MIRREAHNLSESSESGKDLGLESAQTGGTGKNIKRTSEELGSELGSVLRKEVVAFRFRPAGSLVPAIDFKREAALSVNKT